MSRKYCQSQDGERYYGHFDSIMEALHEGFDGTDMSGELLATVHVGEAKEVTTDMLIFEHTAECLLEDMVERASDIAGEAAEGFLDELTNSPYPKRFKEGTKEREQAEAALIIWKDQMDDLVTRLRKTVGEFLSDNSYAAKFCTVENIKSYDRETYEALCKAQDVFPGAEVIHE